MSQACSIITDIHQSEIIIYILVLSKFLIIFRKLDWDTQKITYDYFLMYTSVLWTGYMYSEIVL